MSSVKHKARSFNFTANGRGVDAVQRIGHVCRQRIRPALHAARTHFVATCWLGEWVSGTVRAPRNLEALLMILSILEHTPVWVLFCALIALGIAQTRTREVSSARATILPFIMTTLSLSGVLSAFSQTKYVAGVVLAINPALAANIRVAIALSLVYGAFAGLFWARARSLRSLVRGEGAVLPA
jgi:hypothetical protein